MGAGDEKKGIDLDVNGGPVKEVESNKEVGVHESRWVTFRKHFLLPFLLFIAMVLGVAFGFIIRHTDPDLVDDKRRRMYLLFPGELLLRMLKMIIIPLVVSSLIASIASLPISSAGRLGGRVILYYILTTFLAVLLGILLVTTIKPGSRSDDDIDRADRATTQDPIDPLLNLIRNIFPSNLIAASFRQTQTKYTTEMVEVNVTTENMTVLGKEEVIVDFMQTTGGGTNILGLIAFSVVFGIFTGQIGHRGLPLRLFFTAFQEVIMLIVWVIIWYSPIGVMFILMERIVGMQDPAKDFEKLAYYMCTVAVGLAIHAFIVLPLIYLVFARKNPFKHMLNMSQALFTALGTASSSATLPVTMRCLTDNAGIHHQVGDFVLPVGATINMDGTALYEAVASIFIAQYNGIDLSAGQIITTAVTATAAAIGAAGVPEAGLVTMIIVLQAVGLPIEDVGLIYSIDWFLDRLRTCVNVWGDSVGAGIVAATTDQELEVLHLEEREEELLEPHGYDNEFIHYVDHDVTDSSHL